MANMRPPKLTNFNAFLSPLRPLQKVGKKIWPYMRAGLPILFVLFFIIVNILIIWLGAKLEISDEYPLATLTSRILTCLVFSGLTLVCFVLYQRREINRYYEDKKIEELRKQEPKIRYEARQEEELAFVLDSIKKHYNAQDYLYDLPWYLMVGLESSGKTSLINRSGQEFLFSTTMKASGFKSKNPFSYNWWISNDAIFIDPDSGLISQGKLKKNKQEYTGKQKNSVDPQVARYLWISFLSWLNKVRARRPLNGIILAVDMEYLSTENYTNRKVYAGILRGRIREILEMVGGSIPIYITLTKLDKLHGFVYFFKNLKESERKKLFGFTFNFENSNNDEWLEEFDQQYADFINRINQTVPKLLIETRDGNERWAVYSFTRELAGMKGIIKDLLKEALLGDKFSITPFVRGVYLTSVYQQGVPTNVFIDTASRRYKFNPVALSAQNYNNSSSFFAYDFFNKLLLEESGLARDNEKLQDQKRRTIITATSIGGVATLAFIMLLNYFYSKNVNKLNVVEEKVNQFAQIDHIEFTYDPDAGKLRESLNLIGGVTQEFGNYRQHWPIIADMGMYLGKKIGPEVEKTYLSLLAYKFIPTLLVGLQQKIAEAPKGSDDELYYFRLFTILTNKELRDIIQKRVDNPEIADAEIMAYFSDYWHQQFEGQANIQEDLLNHLNYAMQYTDLEKARKDKDPQAINVLSPYDSMVQRTQQDLSLIPMEQRVYSSFKYRGLNSGYNDLDLRKSLGASFEVIFDIDENKKNATLIPYIYTKNGLKNYYVNESENIAELALIDNWVIGDRKNIDYSKEDIAIFRNKLREQYAYDYKRTWINALNALNIRDFTDINHGVLILDSIVETERPITRLLQIVKENTDMVPVNPEDKQAKTALLQTHAYPLVVQLYKDFQQIDDLLNAKTSNSDIVVDGTTIYIESLTQAIQNIDNLLTSINNAQDVGQTALKVAKDRISLNDADAIYALERIANQLPQPFDHMISKIAEQTWKVILLEAIKEIDRKWNTEVYLAFNQNLANKYPFNPNAKDDVSLQEFEAFFGKNGTIDTFYNDQLKPFLEESAFKFKQGDEYQSIIKPEILAELKNAREIGKVFFNQKGVLGIEFSMSPFSMGTQAKRSILNIEGQYVEYIHGPKRTYDLIWPNMVNNKNNSNMVQLTILGMAGGKTSQITYHGPWALFRMLEKAQLSSVDQNHIRISLSARNIAIHYEITSRGEINPFHSNLLRSFKLSPSLYK